MQAVKVKLYQNMVNYRREMSYGYVQTYPLPTPSMIRGMVHSLLQLTTYYPLSISIQGTYDSVVTNMQRILKFDRAPSARPGNPYHVMVGTSARTATNGVMFIDCLVDVHLTLHIKFEDDFLNQKLVEALETKLIVLGRNEDFARVDDVKLVTLSKETIDEDLSISTPIFMTSSSVKQMGIVGGTYYRLPFCYEPISSYADKRLFKFAHAVYVIQDSASKGSVLQDNEGDIVELLYPE